MHHMFQKKPFILKWRLGFARLKYSTKSDAQSNPQQQKQQQKAENKRRFPDEYPDPIQSGKFKDPWSKYPDSTKKRFLLFLYRSIIVKERELSRPISWEYRQLVQHGPSAKLFPAQEVVNMNISFPFFENKTVRNLLGEKVKLKEVFARSPGGISLVLVSQKHHIAKTHIVSWKKPWKERFPDLNCYEVILTPSIYRPLNWFWLWTLKRSTPMEERKNIFRVIETVDVDPNELGIDVENSFLGYPFLVDKFGHVLWRGVGLALSEELELLYSTTEKWRNLFKNKLSTSSRSKH